MKNEKLYKARKSRGLTQLELAIEAGMRAGTQICHYERYGLIPTYRVAKRISAALKVEPKELWPSLEED